MSKVYLYVAVFTWFFVLTGHGAAQTSVKIDPETTMAEGRRLEITDMKQAIAHYCTAARQGLGRAQYEVGRIYAVHPGKQKNDKGGQRDIAAAMMWLDMAIINKVQDAKILRRTLGQVAAQEDFVLYGQFTRMEAEAPCTWDEVYESSEDLEASD